MAILQRTLASGSIWIGTSSSAQNWSDYDGAHHYPLAIYKNADPVFNFNTEGTTNILELNTTSIRSANYISGFDPTNQGNRGFAIDLINNRYVAEFDDLWVRGQMNVHLFVINQIRATNGSLWVSDAAKATSASSTSVGLILSFESGSALPFVQGDIIRSKRWVVTQTLISNWDVVTVVNSIDYANYTLTGSLAGITYWTASPQSLGNLTQSAGSDWVRIGHTSSTSRQGGIYLTSGDKGSPYIDIYDSVSTVAGGHYNDSGSVDYTSSNVLKLRLGKLTGINTTPFGQLQGYGLYADNAYLKGKIWANEGGNIAGWTIAPHTLSNNQFRLVSTDSVAYLGIGAQTYTSNGIWIGSSSLGAQLSVGNGNNKYIRWTGTDLEIQSTNFSLSAGNVSMSGTVSATSGLIGGWTIGDTSLYSPGITLSSGIIKSIGLNATTYGGTGIYMGTSSAGVSFSVVGSNGSIRFATNSLAISTSNFSAIGGNVTMSGNITAQTGNIGGWNLADNQLYSGKVTLSSISGNSYVGIGSSEYDSNGIYIGSKSAGGNRLSLVSGTNKLLWDGSNLGITTSNFTLSGGNITAKGGTIAAWSIGADSMSATTALSSLILRNATSSAWNMVDSGGYQYSWLDGPYFNWKGKYFSTGSTYEAGKSPWVAISNTSSVSSVGSVGLTKIGFTVSAAGMDKTLVTWNTSHPDRDKITALPGETIHIIINTMSVANTTNVGGRPASPFDLLLLNLINKTAGTTKSVLHSFLLPEIGQTTVYTQNEQIYPGVFATSFTNNSTTGETYSILISVTSSIRGTVGNESLPNFNYNLVIKGLGVGSAKGYTELNSLGLLVYAGPSNFIKISTNQLSGGTSGSNLGIIAVDTIVGGNTTYGYSGGGGTSGGIDGEGTSGTLSLWQDNNTITDSIISQQNSATVSVAGTVSAPVYSGSGFYPTSTTNGTTAIGKLPANANISNKSVKEVLDIMMNYLAPSLGTFKFGSGSVASAAASYYPAGARIGHPCNWTCSASNTGSIIPLTATITNSTIDWTFNPVNISGLTFTTASTAAMTPYSASAGTTSTFTITAVSSLNTTISTTCTILWNAYIKYIVTTSAVQPTSDDILAASTLPPATGLTYTTLARGYTASISNTDVNYLYICYPTYMGKITACTDPDSSNANIPLATYITGSWFNNVLIDYPSSTPGTISVAYSNSVTVPYNIYRAGSYNQIKTQRMTIS